MNTEQALADLAEISSQIQTAVVFDDKGKVSGSTLKEAARAEELAQAAQDLLSAAEDVRPGEAPLTQLEVATRDGSVFVVRDANLTIAATTSANPTVGLVFYDLKSTLRSVKPAAKRTTKPAAARKKTGAAGKKKTAARKTSTRKKPDAP